MIDDSFEAWLSKCPEDMRQALIDVTDTAYLCKRWFERYDIAFTAADLIAMTALVQEREKP